MDFAPLLVLIPYFATNSVELNQGWTHISYVVLEAIPFTGAVLCFLLFPPPFIFLSHALHEKRSRGGCCEAA